MWFWGFLPLRAKLVLALLNFWVVFTTLQSAKFCLCSKCSQVKTGKKGCLPEGGHVRTKNLEELHGFG